MTRERWAGGVLAGFVAALAVVLSLGPIADLRWGLAHHWTASTGRWTLHVPFGWRIVTDGDAGGDDDDALELRRGRWDLRWGRSVDEINLREARGPFDAVDLAQRWERTEVRRMIPGDQLEPTPRQSYLRERYRCSDIKRAEDGAISFACFEREGRRAVWYRGSRRGVHDLVTMLESATAKGQEIR